MSITNGYATLADGRARLGITDAADTTDDSKIESMIEAISRAIDEELGRRFFTTANDETRYFTAEFTDILFPGDILSITTLATDDDGDRTYENTWASGDYDLEPYNAVLDSKPYTSICTTPNGNYAFSTVRKGVKIVGKFGYASSTPKPINEACLLAMEKLFKRKDAIFGVVGSAELGMLKQMMKDDPELNLLLSPYRKFDILGV